MILIYEQAYVNSYNLFYLGKRSAQRNQKTRKKVAI